MRMVYFFSGYLGHLNILYFSVKVLSFLLLQNLFCLFCYLLILQTEFLNHFSDLDFVNIFHLFLFYLMKSLILMSLGVYPPLLSLDLREKLRSLILNIFKYSFLKLYISLKHCFIYISKTHSVLDISSFLTYGL